MAGEIFVGSVAVSVVPDLRGFNDRVRADLVPSSDAVGREIGQAISKGIIEALDIGDIVSKATAKSIASVKADGYALGLAYGGEMRRGIDESLKDITAKVKLDVDKSALSDLKAIASISGGGRAISALGAVGPGGKIPVDIFESRLSRLSDQLDALNRFFGVSRVTGVVQSGAARTPSVLNTGVQGLLSTILSSAAKDASRQIASDAAKRAEVDAAKAAADAAASGGGGRGGFIGFLSNLFGRGGGGGGGGGGRRAGAAASDAEASQGFMSLLRGQQLAGIGQLFSAMSLPAQIGVGAAASATLPFIGQTIGAGGIGLLGTALAGLGIAGATGIGATTPTKGQAATAAQFKALSTSAQADLAKIGVAFIPVMDNIFHTATSVLGKLTPVFAGAERIIAGPFQMFSDTILKSFESPQVAASINAVARAFGSILTALAPDIPGIINSMADAIKRIADAVAKNPKAFADFINFLAQVVIAIINAVAYLTDFAAFLELHFIPAVKHFVNFWLDVGHDIEGAWNDVWLNTVTRTAKGLHDIAAEFDKGRHTLAARGDQIGKDWVNVWNSVWNNTIGRTIRGWHDVIGIYNRLRVDIVNWLHNVQNTTSTIWDVVWNNTIGRAIRGWHDLMGVFDRLKSDVIGFFRSAPTWLVNAGKDIISGLYNGIDSAIKDAGSWIKSHVVDPIVNAVKHFFGISSPSTVMVPIGANIMQGVIKGMLTSGANLGKLVGTIFGGWPQALGSLVSKSMVDLAHLPAKAINALGSIAGKAGSFFGSMWHKVFGGGGGVTQWAGTVMQALAMLHLPMSLLGQVLYQMQTESGGNPNAINRTDINAQMGDPSRGLLQTIGSTFAAYHVPGTSGNIYDPLANVAAAINYALHTYGPSLMSGGMGMGSGHGYDAGGYAPPGASWFWNGTGRPEPVLTDSQWNAIYSAARGGDDGVQYHAHFDGLTGAAIESHVQTAFKAMSLTAGALNRQGRRS